MKLEELELFNVYEVGSQHHGVLIDKPEKVDKSYEYKFMSVGKDDYGRVFLLSSVMLILYDIKHDDSVLFRDDIKFAKLMLL